MQTYLIDTNYFLRYLLNDNEKQFAVVQQLFEKALSSKAKLVSSIIVFFEIYWVLTSYYSKEKNEVIEYLMSILDLGIVEFENQSVLESTLKIFAKKSIDLEDCYNIQYAKSISAHFASFDKKATKIFEN